jgi:hypothetical protein
VGGFARPSPIRNAYSALLPELVHIQYIYGGTSLEKGKDEVLVQVKIGLDLSLVGRLIRTRFMAVVLCSVSLAQEEDRV